MKTTRGCVTGVGGTLATAVGIKLVLDFYRQVATVENEQLCSG